jgi:hypothetical protein
VRLDVGHVHGEGGGRGQDRRCDEGTDEGESLRVEVMDEEVFAGAVEAAATWRWDQEGSAARV